MPFTRAATAAQAPSHLAGPSPRTSQRTPVPGGAARFDASELTWALGSLCSLHQRNFSADMLVHEFPPEASSTDRQAGSPTGPHIGPSYSESTLLQAAQRLGFRVKRIALNVKNRAKDLASLPLPLLVQVVQINAISPPPPQLRQMTLQTA